MAYAGLVKRAKSHFENYNNGPEETPVQGDCSYILTPRRPRRPNVKLHLIDIGPLIIKLSRSYILVLLPGETVFIGNGALVTTLTRCHHGPTKGQKYTGNIHGWPHESGLLRRAANALPTEQRHAVVQSAGNKAYAHCILGGLMLLAAHSIVPKWDVCDRLKLSEAEWRIYASVN